jgi:sec-independent protein translocase protein TatA
MIGDIIQPTHLLFILVVALVVLGPKRLPEVGRSLGNGIRDFRSAMAGIQTEAKSFMDEPAVTPPHVVTESATPTVIATAASTEPDPADYAD